MQEFFEALDRGLADVWRALLFQILPPWLPLIVVCIRDSEKHLVPWAATLGMVGAILAHSIAPGIYFWARTLNAVGVVGYPAAALSGFIYGALLGLLVSGLIRVIRFLGQLGPQHY